MTSNPAIPLASVPLVPLWLVGLALPVLILCSQNAWAHDSSASLPAAAGVQGAIFSGSVPPIADSSALLFFKPDPRNDRVFRWQSSDTVLGHIDISLPVTGTPPDLNTSYVTATRWNYIVGAPQFGAPDRLIFVGSGDGATLYGDVLFQPYYRAVVDVVKNAKRVRYLLVVKNKNKRLAITDVFDQILPSVNEAFHRVPFSTGGPDVNEMGFKAKVFDLPAGVKITRYKWTIDGPIGPLKGVLTESDAVVRDPDIPDPSVLEHADPAGIGKVGIEFESWTGIVGVQTKRVKVEVTLSDGTLLSDEIHVKVMDFITGNPGLLKEHDEWHTFFGPHGELGDDLGYAGGYEFLKFHRRFSVKEYGDYRATHGLVPVTITPHIPLKWPYPWRNGGGPDAKKSDEVTSAFRPIEPKPPAVEAANLPGFDTSDAIGKAMFEWHGQLHEDFCGHGNSFSFSSPREIALYWFHKKIDDVWTAWLNLASSNTKPHFYINVKARNPGDGGTITAADLKNKGIRVTFGVPPGAPPGTPGPAVPPVGVPQAGMTIDGTPAMSVTPVAGTEPLLPDGTTKAGFFKEYDFKFDLAACTCMREVKLHAAQIKFMDPDDPVTPKRDNPLRMDITWNITITP